LNQLLLVNKTIHRIEISNLGNSINFRMELSQKIFVRKRNMRKLNPFHLAIPVQNLALCREFYSQTLGCAEGRSAEKWVDFNFFGHQLVIHTTPKSQETDNAQSNPVDGHDVPVPHFGVVLDWGEWMDLSERLKKEKIHFVIEPYIRFKGEAGEQATMFFLDPDGNALEFKAFKDIDQLFAKG
tara:strand:+ start:4751 stop:5299 length:549 start_codon:yes stop_codon:yes gene_type:complete